MMIELTENNKNLGRVTKGESITFFVGIKNPGINPISINTLQPSCGGCTQAVIANSLIAGGATEQMKIVFTPNSTGSVKKSVRINNILTFTFFAEVV